MTGGTSDDRVRADLAALGDDSASAAAVPPEVTHRVVSALRAAPPPRSRRRRIGAAVGVGAVLAAVGIGTVVLLRTPASSPDRGVPVTTAASQPVLADQQILDLLDDPPDLGALDDKRRRSSCLSGLGYPAAVQVLGGARIAVDGEAAVLLVLPGDTPDQLAAFVVRPNCGVVDTGLIANTQIRRP